MSGCAGEFSCVIVDDAEALDATQWDSLPHPSLYLSAGWLKARSRTVKGAERFLLLSDATQTPVASAPCYLTDAHAHPGYFPPRVMTVDCLKENAVSASQSDRAAVAAYREALKYDAECWAQSFIVAAPGRYGGASFATADELPRAKNLRDKLIDTVERQAKQDDAAAIAWLYLFEGEDPLLEAALVERGYKRMILDAECYLPLDKGSFDGYLDSLRAEYRRKIRYEMAAFDDGGATVSMHGGEALGLELAELELSWRRKYGRTPPIEEILADYNQLARHMKDSLRVFVARKGARAIGFSVFLATDRTWYSRFGGFDYDAGNLFIYFNLLFYYPLQVMYGLGVDVARYSLKSYEAKRSRGCLLRNVLAFVRPPSQWPPMDQAIAALDRAQSDRFAAISNRSITKGETE